MARVSLLGVEFVSFAELAKGSGLSPAKLQRAVSEAGLDIRQFGRTHFVKKSEFEEWVLKDSGKAALAKQRNE